MEFSFFSIQSLLLRQWKQHIQDLKKNQNKNKTLEYERWLIIKNQEQWNLTIENGNPPQHNNHPIFEAVNYQTNIRHENTDTKEAQERSYSSRWEKQGR